MEHLANRIFLRGSLAGLPAFSHENHGRRFYRFAMEVPRLSGALDTLQIVASEQLLNETEITEGESIAIRGQVRSFNSKHENGRKLIISVYAESLEVCDGEGANELSLCGTICKTPVFRRTPLGREICDVMLAVNRQYRRTDYLPCILWGQTAQMVAGLEVGTKICLEGRLQSREYIKVLESGSEKRTAYEISAISACEAVEENQEILV